MPSNFTDFFRPKVNQRNGLQPALSHANITATASATTVYHIPVGRIKVSVLSLALEAVTAAVGSAAITVQVFAVKAGVATALTAATSLTASIVTAQGNFAIPILTAFYQDGGNATRVIDGTAGDYIRVDVVAAGTVTTNYAGHIVAELAVKE